MARPKSKEELKLQSTENYFKLIEFVEQLEQEDQQAEFPEGYLNRNISDVLCHLHQWHLMMLEWYRTGMKGEKPDMPAKGYTWKTLPDLNREIWEQYRDTPLDEAKSMLHSSFADLQYIIDKHTDEELFEKKRYPWTGSTSLGAYLISATSSHYDWALKLIKKCLKNR
ncbi:ClbS/DfsB family four-helix bundle protein [Gracilimonas mengyeensis]|uniref:DinB superfamily protein n=1 Tax=Gracilimonas mengyeensis TaxID=1302730 RepID=A0A521E5L4_9BACT|nr:ClbS/DfsB family four-helix bundle protein [Gracilimonas mengyeensis]SMO79197.1 hypothetical protein SAMN06265219_110181 [Gracilimonas mengyeensis]